MPLVQRAKDILLDPKGTWPKIEAEAATAQSIYVPYVVALAAVPVVAAFIGTSIIGMGGFGMSFRVPLLSGLVNMVVGFVLALVMVFGLALIVDALAPTFGGTKNRINALKLVAYGSTAGFLGGIFAILPAATILGLVAALYSIYLIYTGLPVLMKCPAEKAVGYTAVTVICGIVAGILLSATMAMTTGGMGMRGGMGMMGMGGAGPGAEMAIKTPAGEVKIDTTKLQEMGKRMEEAAKRAEGAQQSGDPAAAAQAAAGMMAALSGGVQRPVVAVAELKAMLPESLGAMKRASLKAESNNAMGVNIASASARYGAEGKNLRLSITDTGGLAGAFAAWANVTSEHEDEQTIEKTYKQGARTVHEEFHKDGSRGEYTVLLANGVVVQAEGERIEAAALRAAVQGLDLARIESLKPPAK